MPKRNRDIYNNQGEKHLNCQQIDCIRQHCFFQFDRMIFRVLIAEFSSVTSVKCIIFRHDQPSNYLLTCNKTESATPYYQVLSSYIAVINL